MVPLEIWNSFARLLDVFLYEIRSEYKISSEKKKKKSNILHQITDHLISFQKYFLSWKTFNSSDKN